MSMDRSLRVKAGMGGKRSVMKRSERIAKLVADKKHDGKKALGLAKTRITAS